MNIEKCESPIEVELFNHLQEASSLPVEWEQQKTLTGKVKPYRVDFYAECKDRRVVVECDGRQFHNYDDDYYRDADLIDGAGVTDIIRFRGCDLMFLCRDCMKFLREMLPFLFVEGATPLGLTALHSKLNDLDVLPIYRGVIDRESFHLVSKVLEALGTGKSMGLTAGNRLAIQLKPRNWGWDFHPPKFWQIGDYLKFKLAVKDHKAIAPWVGFLRQAEVL